MNKLVVKYSIEFVVVVLGIGLSFYVDDLRQHANDVELKNRSLLRIRANIHSDVKDAEWNKHLHKTVIRSCKKMLSKHAHYFDHAQDSLAWHLRYQSIVNSTFLDNTEEYEMLKSAGLMRLIESDSLVVELQSKYSIHDMYKEVEADISRINHEIERCYCELTDLSVVYRRGGYFNHGQYISPHPVSAECLNWVWVKMKTSQRYIDLINDCIERDQGLLKAIDLELPPDMARLVEKESFEEQIKDSTSR
jgi:hypothetical protein